MKLLPLKRERELFGRAATVFHPYPLSLQSSLAQFSFIMLSRRSFFMNLTALLFFHGSLSDTFVAIGAGLLSGHPSYGPPRFSTPQQLLMKCSRGPKWLH